MVGMDGRGIECIDGKRDGGDDGCMDGKVDR